MVKRNVDEAVNNVAGKDPTLAQNPVLIDRSRDINSFAKTMRHTENDLRGTIKSLEKELKNANQFDAKIIREALDSVKHVTTDTNRMPNLLNYTDQDWMGVTNNILKKVDLNKHPSIKDEYMKITQNLFNKIKESTTLGSRGVNTKILDNEIRKIMKSKEEIELDIVSSERLWGKKDVDFMPRADTIPRPPSGS